MKGVTVSLIFLVTIAILILLTVFVLIQYWDSYAPVIAKSLSKGVNQVINT